MTLRFFIIGDPISHSISPCLHNALFKQYGIDARYEALHVRGADLPAFFQRLRGTYRGGNVTIPHKVSAVEFMDELGEEAEHTGAVNTITILEDMRLRGNNTDCVGFVYSLERELAGPIPEPVTIIGAGGAARGILYGLITSGLRKFVLVNRTFERAKELIGEMSSLSGGVEFTPRILEKKALARSIEGARLVINASSLGLAEDFKEFPFDVLKMGTTIVDIVYKKGDTFLMREGLKRGYRCIDALPMLAAQAAFAFQHWTGIMPEYNLVKSIAITCLESQSGSESAGDNDF